MTIGNYQNSKCVECEHFECMSDDEYYCTASDITEQDMIKTESCPNFKLTYESVCDSCICQKHIPATRYDPEESWCEYDSDLYGSKFGCTHCKPYDEYAC